jgi:WD40 repeat protein
VFAVAFSPDSKLLATAHQNNSAQLWDIPSGELRGTLMGHIQAVYSVAFSPDGKTLATGADDRKVKLWNIATQQEVATLDLPGWCRPVKFAPDGCTLAVGCHVEPEPSIRIWDVPSFEEIAAVESDLRVESKQP